MPFIWEIDNKTAFKSMGEPFDQMGRQRKLPIQHKIALDTSEQALQTGGAFFLPEPKLDLTKQIEITDADQQPSVASSNGSSRTTSTSWVLGKKKAVSVHQWTKRC